MASLFFCLGGVSMSSISKGAQRVGSAMSQLAALGYRCSRTSASGQRRGSRRSENGVAGDLIALAPAARPHVVAEIGGAGKRIGSAFAELTAHGLPDGFVPLVGVVIKRRWRWYSAPRCSHDRLTAAIEAASEVSP